jgi:plastocyanin
MRVRVAGAVTGIVAAVALVGCSGSSGGGSATGTTSAAATSAAESSTPAAASGSAASQSQRVAVTATEYSFSLPTTTFKAGTYTFTMANDGRATHAIEIDGPGVADQKSSTAGPGGTTTLTVTLQPGSYTLYCPVGNHRQMGMQTTLTVQ